jgi:hypothetical protein
VISSTLARWGCATLDPVPSLWEETGVGVAGWDAADGDAQAARTSNPKTISK